MGNSVIPGRRMVLLAAEMPARAFNCVKSSRSGKYLYNVPAAALHQSSYDGLSAPGLQHGDEHSGPI
jgi:hypothetical protein